MNFQEFISLLPKSIEFEGEYHYLQVKFNGEYLCDVSFGEIFSIDVLYNSDLTKAFSVINDILLKYEIANKKDKKLALDGSTFGPLFSFVLNNNPGIKTFSTNRFSKLTDIELKVLYKIYDIKKSDNKVYDIINLFKTIINLYYKQS